MIRILLSLTALLWVFNLNAQHHSITKRSSYPHYPGGVDSLERFMFDHAKYPETASLDNTPQGVVYASFIVEANGSIKHITILKGGSPILDSITTACIAAMPRWIPGKTDHLPVPMRVLLPFNYPLGNTLYNVADNTPIN